MSLSVGEKTIGLYGGTFDPIHFGHINLALSIKEAHKLDEVWFCPAGLNPFKQELTSTKAEDRLAMLQLAIADIAQFKILKDELLRPSPSYTIDTLRTLLAQEQVNPLGHRYFLLMGEDSLSSFPNWKEANEIVQLVPILIGSRSGASSYLDASLSPAMKKSLEKGMTSIPMMDISATTIRRRLAAGLYCGHLLPAQVLHYIYKQKLFGVS